MEHNLEIAAMIMAVRVQEATQRIPPLPTPEGVRAALLTEYQLCLKALKELESAEAASKPSAKIVQGSVDFYGSRDKEAR